MRLMSDMFHLLKFEIFILLLFDVDGCFACTNDSASYSHPVLVEAIGGHYVPWISNCRQL